MSHNCLETTQRIWDNGTSECLSCGKIRPAEFYWGFGLPDDTELIWCDLCDKWTPVGEWYHLGIGCDTCGVHEGMEHRPSSLCYNSKDSVYESVIHISTQMIMERARVLHDTYCAEECDMSIGGTWRNWAVRQLMDDLVSRERALS